VTRCPARWIVGALFAGALATTAFAQATAPQAVNPSPPPDRLRVFLDCGRCDGEYLRQTVKFIDYVRDRTAADIHVLVTTEDTGGGGLRWIAEFIGLGRFQGGSLKLEFTTGPTATDDDRRKAFARVFQIGLVGPAATTSAGPDLGVTWTAPNATASRATTDRWNLWVFSIDTNGFLNGERSSQSKSYYVSTSANRTTDVVKVQWRSSANLHQDRFQVGDDTTVQSESHSWNVDGLVVRSVGRSFSVGATGTVGHSSFSNTDHSFSVAPAIEYDVFPYAESSRRVLTLQYAIGATAYRYVRPTIYDRLREVVPRHAFNTTLGLRQPWGSLGVSTTISQHLSHAGRYHVSIDGNADVRLFKGFSFNFYTGYERINDQIALEKGDASEADILLRVRQLATSYSYYTSFGVSYRFGSVLNNIVNPRFDRRAF
jgi:hypothetical protein